MVEMNVSHRKILSWYCIVLLLSGVPLCCLYLLTGRALYRSSAQTRAESVNVLKMDRRELSDPNKTSAAMTTGVTLFRNITDAAQLKHCAFVDPNSFKDMQAPTGHPHQNHTVPLSPSAGPYRRVEFPVDLFSLEQRRQGWVVLHIFGMVYMFISLAIVSDKFFVPALVVITDKLAISNDMAGATIMAAGSSVPELFTSLIGVFIACSNVGIGTIVGSAVFNILFVIGLCPLFSRKMLCLTWWPLIRDMSFYTLDLLLLMMFFLDSAIQWWESLLLVVAFVIYVGFMKHNARLERACKLLLTRHKIIKEMTQEEPNKDQDAMGLGMTNIPGRSTKEKDGDEDTEDQQEENEEPLSLEWPDSCRKRATYLFLLPIVFPLWLTIPDVRNPASRRYFVGTFLGSVLWIALFSYLMVWWAHQVGATVGISEEIVGLTILAAGTSIPVLLITARVARKGLGDMAISSSSGRNIFKITVGLPVPWLLFSLSNGFSPVAVSSNGLFCAIVLLFLILLFAVASIAACKWQMNKVLSLNMFLLYFLFLLLSVMLGKGIILCPVSV